VQDFINTLTSYNSPLTPTLSPNGGRGRVRGSDLHGVKKYVTVFMDPYTKYLKPNFIIGGQRVSL
jgi:hypothetical protein